MLFNTLSYLDVLNSINDLPDFGLICLRLFFVNKMKLRGVIYINLTYRPGEEDFIFTK